MRKYLQITLTLTVIITLILFSAGCVSQNTPAAQTPAQTPVEKQNALSNETFDNLVNAYIYCLPLLMVDESLENILVTTPAGEWYHIRELATSDNKEVVTMNVDTPYSSAALNFTETPAYVIKKPASDRFMTIQLMNAWTDTVGVLGKEADEQKETVYLLTGKDYKGTVPEGMKQIKCDTDLLWAVGRTLAKGEDDLEKVHKLQDGLVTIPLENYLSGETYTPKMAKINHNVPFSPSEYVLSLSMDEFFSMANSLMVNNPPYAADSKVLENYAKINVGPGMKFSSEKILPAGTDVNALWKTIKETASKKLDAKSPEFYTLNGIWAYMDDPIGNFGSDYDYRGYVALHALGANPTEVAIYEFAETDSSGKLLSADKTYRMHLDANQLPQVNTNGFWSITAYGEDDFLIPNALNKYSVSDRTNFTKNSDGSIDIYMSVVKPDNVSEANWIPVKDGNFHLVYRIYLPQDSVRQGVWKAPGIEQV